MPIIIDEQGRREVSENEYQEYLDSLPKVEHEKTEGFEIEYSHDIPSKSLVIVKIYGYNPVELPYPEGFQWNDEWIINNFKNTL